MANIQINSSPPAVALIGEGLNYEIERTDTPTTGNASMELNFPSDQTAYLDKYFSIETFGGILAFTFKTTPDLTGLQLRTWAIADTITEFLNKVISDISANYLINKYYKVSSISGGIKLTAREIGSKYLLDFVATDVTALTEGTNTAGVDDDTPSDYEIYIAAMLYDSTLSEIFHQPLGEDLFNTDDDFLVFPNIAEYLKSSLLSSFTYPYAGTLVIEVPNAVLRYFIRYAEYEDGTIQQMLNTYSTAKYAIAGRLKQLDTDFLADSASDFHTYTATEKKFLSWSPLNRLTYSDVAEKLFFLTEETGLKLMRKAYYFSSAAVETTVQTITQDAYSIIEILCGVPELFAGEDVSDLEKYDVWIVNSADAQVSEFRTFILDANTYENKRTIIFKNSFAMYDLLHCTGILTISDNVKREEYETLSNDVFKRRISLAENTAKYTLNTGWLKYNGKETRAWLEELLLSTFTHLAVGDYLLPVIITSGKVDRHKDKNNLYSITIKFEADYRNEATSSIIGDNGFNYLTDLEYVRFTDDSSVDLYN